MSGKIPAKFYFSFFLIFLALLFFSNFSFAKIYFNSPQEGENLQLLVEGGENKSILIINSEGERFEKNLKNGQLEIFANAPGKWAVHFEGERADIFIKENDIASEIGRGGRYRVEEHFFAIFAFAVFVFAIVGGAAAVAYKFAIEPEIAKKAYLSKKREGNRVFVKFCAGEKCAHDVFLEDSQMKMHARKLEPCQCLQMDYECVEDGKAKAKWKEGEEEFFLKIKEGKIFAGDEKAGGKISACWLEMRGEGKEAGFSGKKEEKKTKKLAKI